MTYKGDIIEESLQDKAILGHLEILSTRVEKVTDRHKTPWLKQWTLHTIEVPEDQADLVAHEVSSVLQPNYWYVDYKDDQTHYIIFPGKVFKIDRKHLEQYDPAIEHGLSLNIPKYQLGFVSNEESKGDNRPSKSRG